MDSQIWKEYTTGSRARSRGEVVVSLWANGVFRLSEAAYRLMGRPAAARIFFNPSAREIALVPAEAGARNAMQIRRRETCKTVVISATGFCRQFGIPIGQVINFDPPTISPDGTLTLGMSEHADIFDTLRSRT